MTGVVPYGVGTGLCSCFLYKGKSVGPVSSVSDMQNEGKGIERREEAEQGGSKKIGCKGWETCSGLRGIDSSTLTACVTRVHGTDEA